MHSLPVDAVIPELKQALAAHNRAILAAPPGSGKTTRVPLALMDRPGTVLVLEPRRLAARSAARFMAAQLGERAGETVGFRVRLESKISARTRVELITEGILTRRLLADPELAGVSCVLFDEFHERSLQADLGLALCLEVQQTLRPDLRLLVMSATLDIQPLQSFLGGCPVIRAEGRTWPVDIRHVPPVARAGFTPHPLDPVPHTLDVLRRVLLEESGSILVFLPGTGEIRRVAERLAPLPAGTSVHQLFGDLSPAAQDAAIAPAPPGCRKIVLATSLAQTSLTIEGIHVVVDAGLARTSRFDPATGMDKLVTERVTQATADQRAGRAGRTRSGICYRLWPQGDVLLPHPRPEILEADLTPPLLDMLAWGSQPQDLVWLTPPPQAALGHARQTLELLHAAVTDSTGRARITPHGAALARLPLHPRLAHMTLCAQTGQADSKSSLAACLAAIVSERDPLRASAARAGSDIRPRLACLRDKHHARLRQAAEQIHHLAGNPQPFRLPTPADEDACGSLLSLAWPDRIAQRRERGSFRLASGRGAELAPSDPLADAPFLAIASLHAADAASDKIYLAAPLDRKDIDTLHSARIVPETIVIWDDRIEAVLARKRTRLDALVLDDAPLAPGPAMQAAVQAAVLDGIRSLGLACLPWTHELRQWQARVLLLRNIDLTSALDSPWPDVSDAALLAALAPDVSESSENWLSPWLDSVTRRAHFASIDLAAALHALVPYPQARQLDQRAPTHITVPSGSSVAIDYTPAAGPVLAVKLQEMFGQSATPAVASGRCPLTLHLLSPAGRPLQITRDLAHFWTTSYPAVRAEMRGRYPKHPWPDDPLQATPTKKVKKKM